MTEYKSEFETVRIAMSKLEDSLDSGVFENDAEDIEEVEESEELEALDELDDAEAETLEEQAMLDGDAEEAIIEAEKSITEPEEE